MRAAVAAELEALQTELAARAPDITEALLPFRREIRATHENIFPPRDHDGEAVFIITAGVPGAGKSTLVNTLEDRDSYREIDPDNFKKICLDIADREGLLKEWTTRTLADGRPIQPGELSTLVHRLSTVLADRLQDDCFVEHENFIRQGTFSWPALPAEYLDSLRVVGGYEGYQVMAVETGHDQVISQASDRWWHDRVAGDLQVRYVSPNVITDMYQSPTDRYSTALSNAVALINHPESASFDLARLTVRDRIDPDRPVTKAYDHTPDHELTIAEIQHDVDAERVPSQRSTGESLLDRVKEIRRQVDLGQPVADDAGSPIIEPNQPEPNVDRDNRGPTL